MSKPKRGKKKPSKQVLALPDLEHVKTAVLNNLTSASGQRTYDHAIREFVAWYCSEPRLAFNRTVVLRYRIHLEQRHYAPADAGLLSPELAAGIRRVKSVRRLGVRLGNWLTVEQGRRLVHAAPQAPSEAFVTVRWWSSSSDAGCGAARRLGSRWSPSSSGRSTG
jgi:hypothetical protein